MARSKSTPFVPTPGERCVYQLKITLRWSDPEIWRRLLIPSDLLLPDLHEVIQIVMPWSESHMHQFIHKKVYYQPEHEDIFGGWGMETTDYEDITVGELIQKPKDKMDYEYDFGDGWIHHIVLEKILPWADGEQIPRCIGGELNAPPEDCGGIPGYYHMLEVLKKPRSAEAKELKEWLGGNFDPNHFDLAEVNAGLALDPTELN